MIQYWIKSWINRDSSLTYSSLIHGLFKIWIDLKINWIWKKKKEFDLKINWIDLIADLLKFYSDKHLLKNE